MTHHRLRFAALCCAALAAIAGWGSAAHAAAQVNKFSLVLSANPTTIDAGEFNEQVIGALNRAALEPHGLEGVENISFGWMYDAQLRYFVRPNFAVSAGVGQLRSVSRREFLPAINAAVEYRAELLTVPVSVGGAYYLPAYNQGDFRAQVYLGGGLVSNVYNRAKFMATFTNTDSARSGQNFKTVARGDAPGFYGESGFHIFFAARYSVMLGVLYRSSVVRNPEGLLELRNAGNIQRISFPAPYEIDYSGIGGRFAVAIGF